MCSASYLAPFILNLNFLILNVHDIKYEMHVGVQKCLSSVLRRQAGGCYPHGFRCSVRVWPEGFSMQAAGALPSLGAGCYQFLSGLLKAVYMRAQAHLLSAALRRQAAASLPPNFLSEGRRLWLEVLDASAEPGAMLVDVSEALARVGLENQRAAIIGRGTFKMDVALRQLDKDGHPVSTSSRQNLHPGVKSWPRMKRPA